MDNIRVRALKLLGGGVTQEATAAALGVTPGRISQLMAEPEFAQAVSEARFVIAAGAQERDKKYDGIEDKLLERMESVAAYLTKPRDVLQALTAINNAKRRSSQQVTGSQTVINNFIALNLPPVVKRKFTVTPQNEVVEVEGQELLTIDSKSFQKIVELEQPQAKVPISVSDKGPPHERTVVERSVA